MCRSPRCLIHLVRDSRGRSMPLISNPNNRSPYSVRANEDSPALLQQMQQAVQREDWLALAAAVHALKSYAGNVGALRFMAQLRELELTAKAGDGLQCIALLAPIPEVCSTVVAALAREAACS